jgi:hypothetical protein
MCVFSFVVDDAVLFEPDRLSPIYPGLKRLISLCSAFSMSPESNSTKPMMVSLHPSGADEN